MAVTAVAQWQPQSPPTSGSIYYAGGNVGIGVSTPSESLEVNGNVRLTQSTGSFSVGGAAPSGYQFFATSSTALVSTAIQLTSNYAFTSSSFIGNFGDFGLYLSQNRNPLTGAFVNSAASPNQGNAVNLVLGDVQRGRLFQVTNYPGGTEAVRLFVDYSGNVGIGTLAPAQKLSVVGMIQSTAGFVFPDGSTQTTAFAPAQNGTLSLGSKAGVGVTDAQATLQVAGDVRIGSNAAGGYSDLRIFTEATPDDNYQQTNTIVPVTAPASGMTHSALHIRNAVAGGTNQLDLIVDGNITSRFQDVAEWVSSETPLEPATVVVLDRSHDDRVKASATPYDTTVAGVVSSTPGLILGVGAAGKEKIATTGRVKVKADATRAPIAIGDLLVTSDTPGTAMKSEPLDLAGTKIHRPGTVIGKALQALPDGRGEILVLLSLQ